MMKIGVFDSGIGGLTVLRQLGERFPGNSFSYFGDTANVPYGTKSVKQIQGLCRSAATKILPEKVDLLVVACNTASSLALPEMNEIMKPIPVVGVVEAGVLAILEAVKSAEEDAPILILGTKATVKSHIYFRELEKSLSGRTFFEQACPLIVPMIEEGWTDHPILLATLREYTRPYLDLKPGIALLGCTHYPFIKEAFQSVLPKWNVIDSATAIADTLSKTFPGLSVSNNSGRISETQVNLFFSDPDAVNSEVIKMIANQNPTIQVNHEINLF
jgi:glutamate racemase